MKNLSFLNAQRVRHPVTGEKGDNKNGAFMLRMHGSRLMVIASDGGMWDHVSISIVDRCPTWEEMSAIKRMFFEPHEWAIEYHPPEAQNISVHPFCLHLWRPQAFFVPVPPVEMI